MGLSLSCRWNIRGNDVLMLHTGCFPWHWYALYVTKRQEVLIICCHRIGTITCLLEWHLPASISSCHILFSIYALDRLWQHRVQNHKHICNASFMRATWNADSGSEIWDEPPVTSSIIPNQPSITKIMLTPVCWLAAKSKTVGRL